MDADESISPIDEVLSGTLVGDIDEWHRPQIGRYHPSRLVYCLYRQWLEFTQPQPSYDPRAARKIWLGSLLHRTISTEILPRTNKAFKPLFYEKDVFWGLPSVPGAMILGRYDALVETPNGELAIVEVKSTRSLDYVIDNGPSEHHVKQLSFYMGATNIRRGILWYIGRGEVDDWFVEIPFHSANFDWIVAQAKMIHSCLVSNTPPPASPVYSWECSYCTRAEQCIRQDRDSNPGIPARNLVGTEVVNKNAETIAEPEPDQPG